MVPIKLVLKGILSHFEIKRLENTLDYYSIRNYNSNVSDVAEESLPLMFEQVDGEIKFLLRRATIKNINELYKLMREDSRLKVRLTLEVLETV